MCRVANLAFMVVTWLGFFFTMHLDASSLGLSQERTRLIREFQQRLNHSFGPVRSLSPFSIRSRKGFLPGRPGIFQTQGAC
jgi:hypothetical protein